MSQATKEATHSQFVPTDEELAPFKTKQKLFILNYLANNGNATQAALAAGYSQKTAYKTGSENLSKPHIAGLIEKYEKMALESAGLTVEMVNKEIARLVTSDVTSLLDYNKRKGLTLKDITALPEDVTGSIQSISFDGSTYKVKNHSKTAALALAMKSLGMDKTTIEHKGNVTIERTMFNDPEDKA
jgi:phage terminase small subunit